VRDRRQEVRAAIYARVSTTDKGQDPELQLKPLRAYCRARGWKVFEEFIDCCSGAKDSRPELDELMYYAKRRDLDCVVVWKLDRFGRSLKHLVNTLEELDRLGVKLVSYQEQIDLTTPTGKLMFHIVAAMAEFERELIKERVRAGIRNAKSKGKRIGRMPIAPETTKQVLALNGQGMSVRQIAAALDISVGAVHKTLKNRHLELTVN
jgi:DNA invertase Pin-like site-specific DNA recombinase